MTGVRPGRCHTAINHCLDNQLAFLPRTHRPADDHAGIQIQHDTEVQPVSGVRMYLTSVTHLVLRAVAVNSRSI
jgi:hypothetical protein